jgi:hypothetical protein
MEARKGRELWVHVAAAAPVLVRGQQRKPDLICQHMWRRVDLGMQGAP